MASTEKEEDSPARCQIDVEIHTPVLEHSRRSPNEIDHMNWWMMMFASTYAYRPKVLINLPRIKASVHKKTLLPSIRHSAHRTQLTPKVRVIDTYLCCSHRRLNEPDKPSTESSDGSLASYLL